ncbi:DNA helicase [Tanacetum coccineum]
MSLRSIVSFIEAIHAERPAQLLEDAQLYLDVFQTYFECCGGKSRGRLRTAFEGTVLSTGLRRANFRKRKLHTDADNNVFESYSSLCSNNADPHNAGPFVSNHRKRTAGQSQIIPTPAEASTSKRARRFLVRNSTRSRVNTEGCSSATAVGSSYTYGDLGDYTQRCRYCGASFWYGERLKGHSHGERVEYHLCCGGGRIHIEPAAEPPEYIKQLFRNKHFMENIRVYNQMFAMTSFGAKIDESINARREIKRFMAQYPELTAADKADVVCRVFEQNIQSLITFLKEERTFGNVTGVLYTVEFQKRGLPHCYTLLGVDSAIKIRTPEEVDRFISAELPDPKRDPDGYKAVSELMMHGPCGAANLKASCMKADKCSKKFPKKFNPKTFFDDNGHVQYQRRDASISTTKHQFKLDNSYVVPYNRDFLLAFQAHINVEPIGIPSAEAGPSRPVIDEIQKLCGRSYQFIWRMQRLTFRDKDKLQSVVHLPGKKNTTLTEWFTYNEANKMGRHLTYLDFPSEFVWGCRDFREVQTVNDVFYPTYRAAYEAMGLLGDDREWEIAFEEACVTATSAELRSLFSHIILHCDVADPSRLWRKFWKEMSHDIPERVSKIMQISNYHLNDDSLQGYILYEIEIILSNRDKSLQNFGLPPPPEDLLTQLSNRLLMEERNYNRLELMQEKNESELEKHSFGKPSSVLCAPKEKLCYQSHLQHSRTAHSRFKLPLKLTEESLCRITKNTQLGKLLIDTNLIIWDEAPMNDQRCFEALDRSLRDIMNAPSSLFEGKSIFLGGDFWQTLPVKKGASKMEVIASCISESVLWPCFKIFTLKENMRLARPDISLEERSLVYSFASWLLDIDDGKIGEAAEGSSWINIPPQYCVPPHEQGLSNLIGFIYDQSTLQTPSATTLQQKANRMS